jgi:hypothetical protein
MPAKKKPRAPTRRTVKKRGQKKPAKKKLRPKGTRARKKSAPTRRAPRGKAARQRALRTPPAVAPAPTSQWIRPVLDHVERARTGFAGQLRKLAGSTSWSHADTPELVGLERWGRVLTALERRAGVRALVAAAQHGFPKARSRGAEALNDLEGAAVEVQILRAARWLEEPSDANAQDLKQAYDRARQSHVWEGDLHPTETECFYWYLEIGQCACAAILNDDRPGAGESYYGWSPSTCVGRGLVIAARGLRAPDADIDAVLEGIGAAIAASFADA